MRFCVQKKYIYFLRGKEMMTDDDTWYSYPFCWYQNMHKTEKDLPCLKDKLKLEYEGTIKMNSTSMIERQTVLSINKQST